MPDYGNPDRAGRARRLTCFSCTRDFAHHGSERPRPKVAAKRRAAHLKLERTPIISNERADRVAIAALLVARSQSFSLLTGGFALPGIRGQAFRQVLARSNAQRWLNRSAISYCSEPHPSLRPGLPNCNAGRHPGYSSERLAGVRARCRGAAVLAADSNCSEKRCEARAGVDVS